MSGHHISTIKKPLVCLFLLIYLSGMLGACAVLDGGSVLQDQDAAQGDQTQGSVDGDSDELAENHQAEDDAGAGDDVPPVWVSCPAEPMEISMFIHHTWNFSPNRDTEMMSVDGRTGALASCPLTVHRGKVSMKDCIVPVTNGGFIQTEDGKCSISTSGFAEISLESGFCRDGVITLTLVESLDPDAGYQGTMSCPNVSQPYIPVYPPSLSTLEFHLQTGGISAVESADPDLSMQFQYNKEWTLISKDMSYPAAEE